MILLAIWVAANFFFSVGALRETRRLLARAALRRPPAVWPALAILRPCAGAEPGLYENLLSTVTARYDGARELFLLVAEASDPAYAIVQAVQARAAELQLPSRVEVVVTAIQTRHNRKVAQLAAGEHLSTAEVVVIVDSDIRLEDESLPELVTTLLHDPRAGAASCPSVDMRRTTLGDRASGALLSSTPHAFFCLAALNEHSKSAQGLCGAFVAIKRPILEQIGGFASLERFLGEDFELARRLHELGHTIPTARAPGRIMDEGRSLSSVLSRYGRWATVTRQQRPHLLSTYFLLLGAAPFLLAWSLVGLVLHAAYAPAVAAGVGVVLALRTALAMTLRRAFGLRAGPLRSFCAMLLGELTIFFGSAGALGRPIVTWRGARFRVGRGGTIELIA